MFTKHYRLLPLPILTLLVLLIVLTDARAQQRSSNDLYDVLQENFKKEYLSFGTLLQAQGFFYADPDQEQSSFHIGTARLGISGNLDNNVSYKLLADLSRSPTLLDMSATYRAWDRVSITAGAQKPGISAGFLLPAADTDFINRPLISSILAGNRDIGVLTKTDLNEEMTFSAGMFNGTNQVVTNNNNEFYYTARLQWNRELESGSLQAGVNGSFGDEESIQIGNQRLPTINGNRLIGGADLRFSGEEWLLSGEYLYSQLEYSAITEDDVRGFHLTAGYNVTDPLQLLARYDHAESDLLDLSEDIITAGANYTFTDVASFTVNYRYIPEGPSPSSHGLLLQTQIAF